MASRFAYPWMVVRLALLVVAACAALVAAIHAQPYDDSALRAFLQPPDQCEMPCWQGIRFGRTSTDDALALLRSNAWVGSVRKGIGSRHSWQWSAQHPSVLQSLGTQFLFSWREDVAETVSMQTLPPLWEFWLILGRPDTVTVAPMSEGVVLYVASYKSQQVYVLNFVDCSQASPLGIWHTQSRVDIGRLVYYPTARPVTYPGRQWFSLFRHHPFC